MNYDYQLHRLGWKAFQQLCGTILRSSMGQTYQTFADSNDAGRDGAFFGTWKSRTGEELRGHFTIQCKHSAKADQSLTHSMLRDEFAKAKSLAAKGLAKNYILMTNMVVSGKTAELIEKQFESINGISQGRIYGRD